MATISLCIIAKNEGKRLDHFLTHHEPLVDEIILADTGSTDNTKKIAGKHSKVTLFDIPWEDDFSKARNETLKRATKDWILILDPDEEIAVVDFKKIRRATNVEKADAYMLQQVTPVLEQRPSYLVSSTPVQNILVRLFRNHQDISFRYRVHEIVESVLVEKKKNIFSLPVIIHHQSLQQEKKLLEAKHEYYKKLIALELKELPQDPKPWFEMGSYYYFREKYKDALPYFEKAAQLSVRTAKPWDFLGHTYYKLHQDEKAFDAYRHGILVSQDVAGDFRNLAYFFLREKKEQLAQQAFGESLKHDPTDIPTLNNAAFLFLRHHQQEKAEQLLKKALQEAKNKNIKAPLQTFTNLAMLYLEQRRNEDAEAMFKQGLQHQHPSAYINLAQFYEKTGRKQEALTILQEAEKKGIKDETLQKIKEELS